MSREDRIRRHVEAKKAGAAVRIAKHDRHFADQYLNAGGDFPVSAALLKTMGHTDDDLSLAREDRPLDDDEFPPKGKAA